MWSTCWMDAMSDNCGGLHLHRPFEDNNNSIIQQHQHRSLQLAGLGLHHHLLHHHQVTGFMHDAPTAGSHLIHHHHDLLSTPRVVQHAPRVQVRRLTNETAAFTPSMTSAGVTSLADDDVDDDLIDDDLSSSTVENATTNTTTSAISHGLSTSHVAIFYY